MSNELKSTGNISNDRRVCTYLPPKHHRLFVAYVSYQEMSESATCADIVKKFFDAMPEQEKQKILNHSRNSY